MKYPGRVITTEGLAFLVGEGWPPSLTPVNIMSGFKKCGVSPINPRAVIDRYLSVFYTVLHLNFKPRVTLVLYSTVLPLH